jgi:hypothetical protein
LRLPASRIGSVGRVGSGSASSPADVRCWRLMGGTLTVSVCRCGPASLVLITNTSLELGLPGSGLGVVVVERGRGRIWWAGERAVGCLRVRAHIAAVFGGQRFLLVLCGAGGSVQSGLPGPRGRVAGSGRWGRWWWVWCLLVCRLRCSSRPGVVWGWRVAGCCLRTAQWTRASLWPSFLGRMVDALVPGTDEGRGRPR